MLNSTTLNNDVKQATESTDPPASDTQETPLATKYPDIADLGGAFYKAIYEQSSDGLMLLEERRFIDCNQRALELIGRTKEEILGKTPWDISPPTQADGQSSKAKALAFILKGETGERPIFDWTHSTSTEQPVEVEVSLSRIPHGRETALMCQLRDISERKQAEQTLKQSEAQYRHIIEDQLDFIVRWLPDGTRTFVSDSYCKYFGQSREELLGTSFFPLIVPEELQSVRRKIETLSPQNPIAFDEHRAVSASGEVRWQQWIDRARFDEHGKITVLQSVGRDIHDRKMAEEALRISEEKFSKAFHCSPEAIIITKIEDGSIMEVNEGFERISGFKAQEVLGRTTLEIGIWPEPIQRQQHIQTLKKQGHLKDAEVVYKIKSGELRNCLTSAEMIEIDGESCLVSVTRDITEAKRATAALQHQATHDALTDLPNRNWLKAYMEELIDEQDANTGFALLLIDLDRFKEINDTLGHQTGDTILKQIGPRLTPLLGYLNGDLARLGGDEFAIIIKSTRNKADVEVAANDLLKALEQPFYFEGMRLEVGASLGIACFPEDGDNSHTLLRCADVAMYVAKEKAVGYEFYHTEEDRHSTRRLALMSELRTAIIDDQLRCYFQPKLDLNSQKITGFEALVRWQHPVHGLIPPVQFVPFAELGESIRPLTYWMLEQAIRKCRDWHQAGKQFSVSVNLSTRNLLDEGCLERIKQLLNHYKLEAHYLEIEITESSLIKDPERVLKNITRLHETGIKLSIDDFGTGYSSMSYLKRMPLHALKIDLSFVTHMLENKHDEIIVKSTVNLAHNLGLNVVAEGVENQATMDMLRRFGCDTAQGYFIAKPLAPEQVDDWLKDNS